MNTIIQLFKSIILYFKTRKQEKFKKKLRQAVNKGDLKLVPEKPMFKYEIPPAKVTAVGSFILEMQGKYPWMTRERIMRKAAEEFKLKANY